MYKKFVTVSGVEYLLGKKILMRMKLTKQYLHIINILQTCFFCVGCHLFEGLQDLT